MWTNIFDLGPVTLYWEDENGALRTVAELAEGTIEEVDGVVVCTGLRSQYTGVDEVLAIVAVPDNAAAGAPIRISVPSINAERPGGGSGPNLSAAVGTAAPEGAGFTQVGDPTVFTAILNDPLNTFVVGMTPDENVEFGELPDAAGAARFEYTEVLS